MFDENALKAEIVRRKSSFQELADACDITLPTFYRKMHEDAFYVREANTIALKLGFSKRDIGRIFFAAEHN